MTRSAAAIPRTRSIARSAAKASTSCASLLPAQRLHLQTNAVELCMGIIVEENNSSLVKSRDGTIPAPKESARSSP